MALRIAEIGTHRRTRAFALTCCLAVLSACSGGASGGSSYVFVADSGSKGMPGFDGFSTDVQANDSSPADAVPDLGDLPEDVSEAAPEDAAQEVIGDDADAADSVSLSCAQTCEIDDDCNLNADPCTAPVCLLGCCQVVPTGGVACDDGVPCNGPDACKNGKCTPALATGCDDGLACTMDTCDGENCSHVVLDGWCHIGTTCVQAAAAIPGDPCKICDPGQAKDTWSQLAGCCKQNSDCPVLGACDAPTCDPLQGKCLLVKIPGCCKSDGDCDDGNLCTTDTCDLASGNCASTAVNCQGPNECQTAACDPADGQCKPELQPGWCFIDNVCTASSASNPSNPCQICQPGNKPTSWSGTPGTPCNDNNACTFSDICNAAGECKGFAQPGCCQTDADCSDNGVACKVGVCNTSVGLCALKDKPGCCASGVCCDTAAQQILPAGTSCGSAVIGSEYQCSGAEIQQRDYTAGCNGVSATACLNSMASGSPGDWTPVSTCPPGTACTEVGSGVLPNCVNLGTCQGACGGTGSTGCSCAPDCAAAGTCCPDAAQLCGCTSGDCCDLATNLIASGAACQVDAVSQFQCAGKTLQKRTGSGACKGAASCALAANDITWGGWTTVENCPNSCQVAADGSSGSCPAPGGTCLGVCGGWWVGQACQCDTGCVANGNCCADYFKVGCDVVTTCYGDPNHSCYSPNDGYMCGLTNATGCNCDIGTCKAAGDCCPDAGFCCYF